mgnify:CR=1 FL=1
MSSFQERHGLRVAQELAEFIENAALPGTQVDADSFWAGFSALVHEFGPENAKLLQVREEMQQSPIRSESTRRPLRLHGESTSFRNRIELPKSAGETTCRNGR